MALLFMDGFDHYGSATDLLTNWTSKSSGGLTLGGSYARSGAQGLFCNGTGYVTKTLSPSTTASGVAGMALRRSGPMYTFFRVENGDGSQLLLTFNGSYQIELRRGGVSPTLLATSTLALNDATWYYIECKWTIANSGGTVEVRVNGDTWITYTGDTQQQSAATWNLIFMGSLVSNNDCSLDDVYILDQTAESAGPANNTFLGPVKVVYLTPTSDGTYTEWACSTGSTTYTLVDDSDPDTDATDYVASSTVGSTVTCGLGDLPTGVTTVYGVQLLASLSRSDAGARSVTGALYTSATLYTNASPVTPSDTSYTYGRWVYAANPATSSTWATSAVDGLEVGVKVTA